ncbi:MAG: hypothetical protein IRY85_02390 [Micromonosporaceae bacterium]|nr:hypothetical protein [Micromonosporaceae bacterium]
MQSSKYTPPPPTAAPPVGWRPYVVVPTAPPRPLPAQDHAAIDAEENAARRFTVAVAVVAMLTLTVLLAVLYGQMLG